MAGARTARQRSERAGRLAETVCAIYLRLKGYGILGRRYRAPNGEVDIVVRRGNTVVFVEIKLRRTLADALEALGPIQRQRIVAAAATFLAVHPKLSGLDARFDVMLVVPWRLPVHIANAWHI